MIFPQTKLYGASVFLLHRVDSFSVKAWVLAGKTAYFIKEHGSSGTKQMVQ